MLVLMFERVISFFKEVDHAFVILSGIFKDIANPAKIPYKVLVQSWIHALADIRHLVF